MTVRTSAASIHRWVGLTIGLLGIYMAATGAWILYRPQLDPVAHPAYMSAHSQCATRASMDAVAAAARQAYPKSPIDSLWPKGDPTKPVTVRYGDAMHGYFDPCTARLLGLHSRWAGTFGWIEYLHRFRFFEIKTGELVAGTIAAVMASLLALLGLFIWWPRRRAAWKTSVRLDPKLSGRAKLRNRHSVVGVFVLPILLIVSLAGTALAFEPVEELLYTLSGSKPITKPKIAEPAPETAPVAYQAAWNNVLAALPAIPREATLRPPKKPGAALEIYLIEQGISNPEGRTYFYADPATGRILSHMPYAQTPAGQRLYGWALALHKGEVGGVPGQLLTLIAMLGTLYLGYSGVKGWLLRNRRTVKVSANAPIRMRLAAVTDEADGVKAFRLVPTDAAPLAAAEPGAHVEVRLPDGTLRHYSLINGPDDLDHYTLAVRAEANGRGGSLAMHALATGIDLQVSRPRNHFPIVAGTERAVLVAAGIGITPLLSMARHLQRRGTPFELHYFGRRAEGMPYRAAIAAEGLGDAVHVHVGLDRDEAARKLTAALAVHRSGDHLYTCGPSGFMDTVFAAARAGGWPDDALHREAFEGDSAALARPRDSFDVMLARSGRTLTVDADMSLLDALIAAKLPMASSCEQGVCGSCQVRVLSGDIDHRDAALSDADRCKGDRMMACVSRAKAGSLVLDL